MRDAGHPEPPPPALRWKPRIRSAPAALVALGIGLLVVACGSGSSSTNSEFLSTKQTKLAIEESILNQRHIHATVACPTEVVREKGVTFQCVATTPNGARTIFHVVEANSRGYVEYSSVPENAEKKQIPENRTATGKTTRKKS